MASNITETKLILSESEAANYAKYLLGLSKTMSGSSYVYMGLGNIRIEHGEQNPDDPEADTAYAVFEEIPIDEAETDEGKTTNYARAMVHGEGGYPNVLKVDPENPRRIFNHEQIVFNKVKTTPYKANAIGLYRNATSGTPYAFGLLETPLEATVGSLPMFEREKMALIIPDGGDIQIPAAG